MPQLIIISGNSGAGKNYLINTYYNSYAEKDRMMVADSFVTRPKKDRDDGTIKKYYYPSVEEFLQKKDGGFFFEWEEVHGKYYGTPNYCLSQAFYSKPEKDLFLEIDLKGALKILDKNPIDYDFKPKPFFIWRDIDPREDFDSKELQDKLAKIIIERESNLSPQELLKRQETGIQEYLNVRNHKDKFIFLENDGKSDSFVQEFSEIYKPGFPIY